MAKSNVIVFDGEDKFISKKKHIYNKNKGKAIYVGADGNESAPTDKVKATPVTVVSTSTTTQDTANVPQAPPATQTPVVSKTAPSFGTYQGNEAPPSVTNVDQYQAQTPGGTVSTNKPGDTFVKVCGAGTIWNADNGACEPDPNYVSPTITKQCGDGQYFDPIYNKCIDVPINCDPPKLLIGGKCVDAPETAPVPTLPYQGNEKPPTPKTKCPDGWVWSEENGACENPDDSGYKPKDITQCKDGQYFDPIYNKCIDLPPNCEPPNQVIGGKCVAPIEPTPNKSCPKDFIWDEGSGQCVPYTPKKQDYTTTTTTINPECGPNAVPRGAASLCPDGFAYCPQNGMYCIPVEPLVTTSTTTTTTTTTSGDGGGNVIIPGLGIAPSSGGGGGGGGGSDDSTPQAVAKPKDYFWYYVAAGAIGFYLFRKFRK